jgi:hypothetical protein
MGKSIFPVVAEWKGDNPFQVRAKLVELTELSCSEHGIQYGNRITCWKCGKSDLVKSKKKLISFYVNKVEDFDKAMASLTERTKLNWKWNRFAFPNSRQVAYSLKAYGTDLANMLASFGDGFEVNQLSEAELNGAFEKEQNNKLLGEL